MSKYLIHACNERLWYVNEYLMPSMLKQGINDSDINIQLDKDNEGCLTTCMKAFINVPREGYTWHLQDDIIISSDFKERTEEDYKEDIVCGYCYDKDARKQYVGKVLQKQMWYSFPCIRIDNKISRACAKWYFNYAKFANEFHVWVRMKKYDDTMFEVYLQRYWLDVSVLNLVPNIVDHIDYLIGGSVINKIRPEKETHATYFKDKYLIDELTEQLKNNS